jgi:agmatine deiminase
MPGEETPHERTLMAWPSDRSIWGGDLADVQRAVARVATAIAKFEPVWLLARPDAVADARGRYRTGVTVRPAPVDFLLPVAKGARSALAAGRFRFNGWGGKQKHEGDAELAALVAKELGIPLVDSGIAGEGGGIEIDGTGTVLAAASSWVNKNRNPGLDREALARSITDLLGARRVLWVDGVAGKDITDGHIDTMVRFAGPGTILIDRPDEHSTDPFDEAIRVARRQLEAARTDAGAPYVFVELPQPATTRRTGGDFVASYINFYVCNGAVICPEFGDEKADGRAREILSARFPGRTVVQVDIDGIAAGGGGIHCATQQQPRA